MWVELYSEAPCGPRYSRKAHDTRQTTKSSTQVDILRHVAPFKTGPFSSLKLKCQRSSDAHQLAHDMTAAGNGLQPDLYMGTEMNDSYAKTRIPGHVEAVCILHSHLSSDTHISINSAGHCLMSQKLSVTQRTSFVMVFWLFCPLFTL